MSSTRVSCPPSSMRLSSTLDAMSEKTAKFTPVPSNVAPSGYGLPGHISTLRVCTPFTDSGTTLSPDHYALDPWNTNATSIAVIHSRQVLTAALRLQVLLSSSLGSLERTLDLAEQTNASARSVHIARSAGLRPQDNEMRATRGLGAPS